MRTTRILASLAVAFLGTVAFAGCSQTPAADDSFEDTIPAALQASDLGITEAFADKGVDGLTTHIMVGATFDRSELSTADVKKFVSLIVANNTVSVRYLLLVPEDPDGEEIDIVAANNDEMAIGAIMGLQQAGKKDSKILIGGIDATPDGLKAMSSGKMQVTVFQDAIGQGKAAVDVAQKMIKGEKLDPYYWIPFELVTPATLQKYVDKE